MVVLSVVPQLGPGEQFQPAPRIVVHGRPKIAFDRFIHYFRLAIHLGMARRGQTELGTASVEQLLPQFVEEYLTAVKNHHHQLPMKSNDVPEKVIGHSHGRVTGWKAAEVAVLR